MHELAANANPYQELDRATLEQRLLQTEGRIAELLPADQKFKRDPRSPENEAIAKRFLDRVFKSKPGETPPYTVECHGRTCKLDSSRPLPEWQEPLQMTFPERSLFCQMSFSDEVYVELCRPDLFVGGLISGIQVAFYSDKQAAACSANNSVHGDLLFDVQLDASRSLRADVSGSLSSQPVGLCLRKVFDEVLTRVIIPPEVTSLPSSLKIKVQVPFRDDPE